VHRAPIGLTAVTFPLMPDLADIFCNFLIRNLAHINLHVRLWCDTTTQTATSMPSECEKVRRLEMHIILFVRLTRHRVFFVSSHISAVQTPAVLTSPHPVMSVS